MSRHRRPRVRGSLLDGIGASVARVQRGRRGIFPDGWGDESRLGLLNTAPESPGALSVLWGRKEEHPGFRVRRGQSTSPVAHLLPAEARVARVEVVEPGRGAERMCVLLPAWNDEGFVRRRRMSVLLARRGIASLSFEIPLYGSRRVVPEPAPPIRTVADFAVMGHVALVETLAALAMLADDWRVLGVSGYSMGGNLAALASAVGPRPLATAPLAASHSPAPVYLDGALRHAICWPALGGRAAEERLREVLGAVSALATPPLRHHAAAVLVAGERDAYVPPEAVAALARHWAGAELRWVPTGHAGLLLRHLDHLADGVADAFSRLEEAS